MMYNKFNLGGGARPQLSLSFSTLGTHGNRVVVLNKVLPTVVILCKVLTGQRQRKYSAGLQLASHLCCTEVQSLLHVGAF